MAGRVEERQGAILGREKKRVGTLSAEPVLSPRGPTGVPTEARAWAGALESGRPLIRPCSGVGAGTCQDS